MTQNNIILYGNPVRMIQNWPRILYGHYRPAGGRVGWLKSIGKESILGICILKNLNIVYIIESWLFYIFTKKTRAEKWWNLVAVSRRDLSYETDSGPKTKTVKTVTWDLAYYFFIVIFYYSSASVIFFWRVMFLI